MSNELDAFLNDDGMPGSCCRVFTTADLVRFSIDSFCGELDVIILATTAKPVDVEHVISLKRKLQSELQSFGRAVVEKLSESKEGSG